MRTGQAAATTPRSDTGAGSGDADAEMDVERQEPFSPPKVKLLLGEMEGALNDASSDILPRMELAHDTLRCYWNGQSEDGRKHAADLGKAAFPWEGAADHRVRMAEEIVRERVLLDKAALQRGKMQAVPREVGDGEKAAIMTLVLGYFLGTLMRREVGRAAALLSHYKHAYGSAVLKVGWKEERAMGREMVTADGLLQEALETGLMEAQAEGADEAEAAVIAQTSLEEMREILFDPNREERLRAMLVEKFPEANEVSLRRAMEDLRETGQGTLLVPYTKESRPTWRALLPMVDVFFPIETECLEEARWIAEVQWLTRTQLEERAATEGWDATWLRKVRGHPGRALQPEWEVDRFSWTLSSSGVRYAIPDATERELYQILEVHYKAVDSDGIPCTHRVVVHGADQEGYAIHEPCEYLHGRMPFIDVRREVEAGPILSSRGIGEVVLTDQAEVKLQRDARADATTIATLPPVLTPPARTGLDMQPLAQIPRPRGQDFEWFAPPNTEGKSVEVELAVRHSVDRYFGRSTDPAIVPPDLAALHQQDSVDDWLADMAEAVKLTGQLIQQFMDPIRATRVAGMPVDLRASREEIQGQFDLELTFDARDLSMEFVKTKLDMVANLILPFDAQGITDRAKLTDIAFSMLDPRMAREVMRPAQQVSAQEEEDELRNIAVIMAGEQPAMIEQGQNHELRAQVMVRAMERSPHIQRTLAEDDMIRAVWEERLKHHAFQQQQQVDNKIIGRTGGKDVLGESMDPMRRMM